MSSRSVIPVILSGGAGLRLWPLSRQAEPKQFLRFTGEKTLIEETLKRCSGDLFDQRPVFVAAAAHRKLLEKSAAQLNLSADLVLEPLRRDSCAAIIAGALHVAARDPDALMLVVAADHSIPDTAAFHEAIANALPAAEAGYLVTFGIKPSFPATGYGYILPGDPLPHNNVRALGKFIEKPDAVTAELYIKAGYLWNSGNFLFRASAVLDEARKHDSELVQSVQRSLEKGKREQGAVLLDAEEFARARAVQFDIAVMEKTTKAAVTPVAYAWSDIGTWDAVANAAAQDEDHNAVFGKVASLGCKNTYVHSEHVLTTVIDCEDIVVVTTKDAVLVMKRGSSEKVKALVEHLKNEGRAEI